MDLVHRVATRFLLADVIGDPSDLTKKLKAGVDKFADLEPKAEKLLAHMKTLLDVRGTGPVPKDPSLFYQLTGAWNTTMYGDVSDIYTAVQYTFHRLKPTGTFLFMAILQQLALPPALTKKVQACARYWSKSNLRIQKSKEQLPRHGEEVIAYEKLLKEFRMHVAIAQEALAKGKSHTEEGSTTKLNAGPFTVINTGSFSEEAMEQAAKAVSAAAKLLSQIGLSRICYGDVLVSNTLTSRSNVLAFYLISKDEMFVRANVKADVDVVRVICHELTHRLDHKFLKSKQREIASLYQTLASKSDVFDPESLSDFEWPRIGKYYEYQGRHLKVVDVDFRKKTVKWKDPKDPPNMSSSAPIQYWVTKIEGKPIEQQKGLSFVSGYAKKSPGENFAEMVSFYAIGKLPQEQVELLKPILDV